MGYWPSFNAPFYDVIAERSNMVGAWEVSAGESPMPTGMKANAEVEPLLPSGLAVLQNAPRQKIFHRNATTVQVEIAGRYLRH